MNAISYQKASFSKYKDSTNNRFDELCFIRTVSGIDNANQIRIAKI